MSARRKITDEEVEEGLAFVAGLIDRHGDAYWPIFERLEQELEQRRSPAARLQAHLNRDRRFGRPTVSATRHEYQGRNTEAAR